MKLKNEENKATQILWDVLFHMVQTFKTFEVPYYFEPESGSKREVPFEVPYYFEPESGSKREVLFEVPYQFEPPGSEREVLHLQNDLLLQHHPSGPFQLLEYQISKCGRLYLIL